MYNLRAREMAHEQAPWHPCETAASSCAHLQSRHYSETSCSLAFLSQPVSLTMPGSPGFSERSSQKPKWSMTEGATMLTSGLCVHEHASACTHRHSYKNTHITHTFRATEVSHPKYGGHNHLSAFSTAVSQHASKKTLPVTVLFSF